jgi:hypothetical protein
VLGLLRYAGLRLRAEALGISQVDAAGGSLHLRFASNTPLPPETLVRAARGLVGGGLSPQGILKGRLSEGEDPVERLSVLLAALEDPQAVAAPGL